MGAPLGNRNAAGKHFMKKGHILIPGHSLGLTPAQFRKLAVKETPALRRLRESIMAGPYGKGLKVKKVKHHTFWHKKKMTKYRKGIIHAKRMETMGKTIQSGESKRGRYAEFRKQFKNTG